MRFTRVQITIAVIAILVAAGWGAANYFKASAQTSTVNGPVNGIGINTGTINIHEPAAPVRSPETRQERLMFDDATSKCMDRDHMPGDSADRRKWLEPCINELLAVQGTRWRYQAATDQFVK
jgi:hypothetical protein